MRLPPTLCPESTRLQAVAEYGLNSGRALPGLEPIVEIAAQIFGTPHAAVNLVGENDVFFIASCGAAGRDMTRDISFCAHVISQEDVMVVEDARLDSRFQDNPLVTGKAQIRFYAGVPVCSLDGHAIGVICIFDSEPRASFSNVNRARLADLARLASDRLELRRLEVAGHQGLSRFAKVGLATPNGIICIDELGRITAANPAVAKIFGLVGETIVGTRLETMLPMWEPGMIAYRLAVSDTSGSPGTVVEDDNIACLPTGETFPVEVAWTTWMENDRPYLGLVIRDLREQRRQQDELFQLAKFDPITSLPDLNYFRERVSREHTAAILMLDLSEHHDMNGSLASKSGELALQIIADRLRDGVRSCDFVARTGTEEFAICLSGVGDPLRAKTAAVDAMAAVAESLNVDGSELWLHAHCGIALYPDHGDDAAEVIDNARMALREACKPGTGDTFLFVPALRMQAVARRLFDVELHQAAERGEFQLYFQPQVRLSDGALTGAEALLRWNHPIRGVLSPAAFLPALEASSLAESVGMWIIDVACQYAARWSAELSLDFRMSINLFATQFHVAHLRTTVNEALARYHLPGSALELEITEGTVIGDEILPLLNGLIDDGIRLAFDDFGTGFASLSLLARYPLTHVKIDRSFIQKALVSERDRAIVQAMTDLAHELQLEVIAEGVESRALYDLCKKIGCDEAQGFLIGKPVPAQLFTNVWKRWRGQVARQA